MNQFQRLWERAFPRPQGDDPATVKAAQKGSRAARGVSLNEAEKQTAGNAIHYLFGAGVGAAYGLLAEYRPGVTRGLGTGLAMASATAFDEAAVPALGLSKSPTDYPAKVHAYSYASHLVYGGVTEAVRRLLRLR